MTSITYDLATPADGAALRRLLRENPMPGSISLSFEREPCYFHASALEGPFHQTLVARESDTGNIVGLASRSVRPMFLNGLAQSVGYLSQLRIHRKYGKSLFLARGLTRGFEFFQKLHADRQAPFYLMSIIADNAPARRLLASGFPGFPRLHEYARLFTYAIYPVRPRRPLPLPRSLRLVRGDDNRVHAIVDCLERNGARKQFAPHWTADSLFTADLTPAAFFLALDGKRVVGCLACWDQSRFKQTVVRGYSGPIARWRPLINALSKFGGWPTLPNPHTPLHYCYASHLAIDDDDPQVFAALLRALYNHAAAQNYSYFMIGLSEANPLCEIVKTYRPITYIGQLYLVAWEDGQEAVTHVDHRIPAPEIAVL